MIAHKCTLHFETERLEHESREENLVHKIAIVSTIHFNSFLNFEWSKMVWSTILAHILTPLHLCFLLLATDGFMPSPKELSQSETQTTLGRV